MDVRPNQDSSTKFNQDSSTGVKTSRTISQFKSGIVQQASAAQLIPPAIATKLSQISKVYGLPFDLAQVSLQTVTPENIQGMRSLVDLLVSNSKLLPELMKLTNQLLKADIKLAEFHKNLTKSAAKHQTKLDKVTADIWLQMANYGAKAAKLEYRTNTRTALIEKRDQARANYYQQSVYGNESALIDAEYQILASDSKILSESKIQKMQNAQERKQKLQEYVNSAY